MWEILELSENQTQSMDATYVVAPYIFHRLKYEATSKSVWAFHLRINSWPSVYSLRQSLKNLLWTTGSTAIYAVLGDRTLIADDNCSMRLHKSATSLSSSGSSSPETLVTRSVRCWSHISSIITLPARRWSGKSTVADKSRRSRKSGIVVTIFWCFPATSHSSWTWPDKVCRLPTNSFYQGWMNT